MTNSSLKTTWKKNYESGPDQLKKMSNVKGLISAFNANIDAVVKMSGKEISELISKQGLNVSSLFSGKNIIKTKEDLFRGIIHCFSKGIAEEWLISDINIYNWLQEVFGYGRLQMGGQGGIVANAMAICGVDPVYVHCASLPKLQSDLFLDLDNLKSVNTTGEIQKAFSIERKDDIPLIHYIIEFDKGDNLIIDGISYTCPKSNRFIATYDPLNFKLHIDETFVNTLSQPNISCEYIILSGYQMLQEINQAGVKGIERIDISAKEINKLRKNEHTLIHFEVASTQDKVIRKHLIENIATKADSIGFNERELIDILEVIEESSLADECDKETNSVNLFRAMLKVYKFTGCPRLQLHMFGLYITLQNKNQRITPFQNRRGMQLAANIAAAKAGTGTIDLKENLYWAFDKEVSDIGLKELKQLSDFYTSNYGFNQLTETGIFETDEFDIIAVPTIIIDNPITLVGMGDTISSVSLVASV